MFVLGRPKSSFTFFVTSYRKFQVNFLTKLIFRYFNLVNFLPE